MAENELKQDGTKKNKEKKEHPVLMRAVPIILFAFAIFIALCFITRESTGAFGKAVVNFLLGSFSVGGYIIPALFALHALTFQDDVKRKRIIPRVILSLLIIISVSTLVHCIRHFSAEPSFTASLVWKAGQDNIGGGFVGGVVAFALKSVVGNIGLIIVMATALLVYSIYFFSENEKNPIKSFFGTVLYGIVSFLALIEKGLKKAKGARNADRDIKNEERRRQDERKQARRIEELIEREGELYDDDYVMRDTGLSELHIPQLGINERIDEVDIERNPTLQVRVHPRGLVEDEPPAPVTEPPVAEPQGRRPVNFDYTPGVEYTVANGGRDFVGEIKEDKPKPSRHDAGIDDSAENVFTDDFNGFDVQANERAAARQSTVGAPVGAPEPAPKRERPINDSEVRAARMRGGIINQKKETPKAEPDAFEPITVEFDINPEHAPKAEPVVEPVVEPVAKPEPVNEDRERAEQAERRANDAEARLRDAIRRAEEAERKYLEEQNRQPAPAPAAAPVPTYTVVDEPEDEEIEVVIEDEPIRDAAVLPDDIVDGEEKDEPVVIFDEDDEDEDDVGEIFTGDGDTPVIDGLDFVDDEDEDDGEVFTYDEDEDDEGDDGEIPPEKQNPQVKEYRNLFNFLKEEDGEEDYIEDEPQEKPKDDDKFAFTYADRDDEDEIPEPYIDDDDDEPPFDVPTVKKPVAEAPKSEKPDYSNFEFPSIELLAPGREQDDPQFAEEISEYGDKLIDALDQFDVRASIRSVDRGPRITRYEIVPARGVRVNKVINLFDDIALNLAAEGIRMEAPIPGKSAIGVEIPNKHPSTVYLRDLLESEEFISEKSKTFACVGKDVTGNPIFCDVAKMPHMLIAGATGMGKSVCINSILISILYKARPDEVKLIMIDPKTVEFTMYNGIPHLLVPIVTEVKQAAGALMWAVDEMERRYALLAKHEVRKLEAYNELVKEHPELGEPLPKIIIVIDELNDLMQQVKKPVESLIMRITQKARAAGIHMIIGTQRPSVDVVTGVIKANIPSRIACKVTSFADSKTILDQSGAEKLLDKGDMLYAPVGKPKPIRVQGAFVADGEVEKIMRHLKSTVKGNIYDEEALAEMTRAAQKCTKGKGDDDDIGEEIDAEEGAGYLNDKQFLDSVDLAIKQGKISTSLIQRKISIGYGKAAKFIDIMEDLGLVSEPNGQKPRDVLVTRDQWHEMLARRSLDD